MNLEPTPLGAGHYEPLTEPLRLTSWNVWFDRHQRERRFQGLLEELSRWRPHLMAFQEVTMPFVRAILACEWLQGSYWISAREPNQLGVLMVGRVLPSSLRFEALPSEMGRRLLLCEMEGVTVASCHLESTGQGGPRRKEQLARSFQLLNPYQRCVLMGDFNFADGTPECSVLDSAYQDAWGDQTDAYTIDSQRNSMLTRTRPSSQVAIRIDRVLSRGLRVDERSLLGTEPIEEGLHPSDHFGLRVDLS